MELYEQLKRDLNPNDGIDITVNKDLSFSTPKKQEAISTYYLNRLKDIAMGIDVNINKILDTMTTGEIDQAINDHGDIPWEHPTTKKKVYLTAITKDADKRVWLLEFVHNGFGAGQYQLHDCQIEDVLGFMGTIESVIA